MLLPQERVKGLEGKDQEDTGDWQTLQLEDKRALMVSSTSPASQPPGLNLASAT